MSPRAVRVVLGVSGGVAAYKAVSLLRRFTETGHDVTVVPTDAALAFVGAPTWSALSGKPVTSDPFDDVHEVRHVRLGQDCDLLVIAPATADLLAKAAHGLAGDLLTNVLLTARGPVVMAPAMHTEMWQHPATQANVATLRSRGVHVIEPASGRLTGADSGPGRLPEPEEIFDACQAVLAASGSARLPAPLPAPTPRPGVLAGVRVVISAGGTREPLDPVRYLGNRSSGKQGYALAQTAVELGADVTLVAANVALAPPQEARVVPVETALELQAAVDAEFSTADFIVMAAAVADFRPALYVPAKIKKSHDGGDDDAPTIALVRNPDVLAGLVRRRASDPVTRGSRPLIVGFAAETGDADGDVLHHARVKLAHKGCDLLIANEVGSDVTFGKDTTTVHVLRAHDDEVTTIGPASKVDVSRAIWSVVADALTDVGEVNPGR
jgi:phosphopantothenoylcysteine decarboxylase / phosphopantothenate---cysteine ligase